MFNPIRKRVMLAVNQKINEAEATYKNGCEELDEECKSKKSLLLDKMVDGIIGKFIK